MKIGSRVAREARLTARIAVALGLLAIAIALSGCNTYQLNYIGDKQGDDCVYYFMYKSKEYTIVDKCGIYTYEDKFTPAQFKNLKK